MIKGQKDVILHTKAPLFCHGITAFLSRKQQSLLQTVSTPLCRL
jgi:hypothetical protein